MKKILAAVLLALSALPAFAVDWICTQSSAPVRVAVAAADDDSFAPASVGNKARSRKRLERTDLMQAYSGQPVLMGHTWLLAVMLPASHPDTRAAFSDLGLSAEAAERMASGSGLVDRGIRLVRTPAQLVEKMSNNPPAVGYVGFFSGARDVELCF